MSSLVRYLGVGLVPVLKSVVLASCAGVPGDEERCVSFFRRLMDEPARIVLMRGHTDVRFHALLPANKDNKEPLAVHWLAHKLSAPTQSSELPDLLVFFAAVDLRHEREGPHPAGALLLHLRDNFLHKLGQRLPANSLSEGSLDREMRRLLESLIVQHGTSRFRRLDDAVQTVTASMLEDLEKAIENSENLKEMESKALTLETEGHSFYKGARKLERQMWWQKCRNTTLVVAAVVIVLLLVVVVPIAVTVRS